MSITVTVRRLLASVLAILSVAAGALIALPVSAAHADESCPTFMLIGARGSGESLDKFDGISQAGDQIRSTDRGHATGFGTAQSSPSRRDQQARAVVLMGASPQGCRGQAKSDDRATQDDDGVAPVVAVQRGGVRDPL